MIAALLGYALLGLIFAALSSKGWGIAVFFVSLLLTPLFGGILMVVSWLAGGKK